MEKKELVKRLEKINNEIKEVQKRLPAHSVKPTIMQELFELEDKRDELQAQLERDCPGVAEREV